MAKSFTKSAETLAPDAKFSSKLVSKFINCLMYGGKKNSARNVFYDAMQIVENKVKDTPPLQVFTDAVTNVRPKVEVRSKRVGGANYQVPMAVKDTRQQSLAIRWLIASARSKKGRPMAIRLADEILAAFRKEGDAVKKRDDVHRMADANKAFAHFAW
jgi:small subunit ribosomal protein S7